MTRTLYNDEVVQDVRYNLSKEEELKYCLFFEFLCKKTYLQSFTAQPTSTPKSWQVFVVASGGNAYMFLLLF